MNDENHKVTGACLCGAVRFSFLPPALVINNCHCSLCRKASGGAFGSYLHIPENQFQWLAGYENIVHYAPGGLDPRPFCKTCGCRVPILEDGKMTVPAGLLNDDPELKVAVNTFVGSKANWYEIQDDLPAFQEGAGKAFWEPYFHAHAEKIKSG